MNIFKNYKKTILIFFAIILALVISVFFFFYSKSHKQELERERAMFDYCIKTYAETNICPKDNCVHRDENIWYSGENGLFGFSDTNQCQSRSYIEKSWDKRRKERGEL